MKRRMIVGGLLALSAWVGYGAEQMRPTELPQDRLTWKDGKGKFFWKDMYEEQRAAIANSGGTFDFVLVGDSITRNWVARKGKSYFGGERALGYGIAQECFAGLTWLNAGIGGDGVSQVLWRCQNGILDGYTTKLIALLVGTNNRRESAEDVAAGIARIVAEIRQRQPSAKLLLSPILPRFPREDDPGDMNAKNEKTNEIIRKLCDGEKVVWFDWRAGLYAASGELNKDLWYDREHPAEGGYRVWAEALLPHVMATLSAARKAQRQELELAPQGGGTLRFVSASGAFSVLGFDYGAYTYADGRRDPRGLWKLRFRAGAAGEERVLEARAFKNGVAERTRTGYVFAWKGLDLDGGDGAVDVTCHVDWRAEKQRYEFRIRVNNRSTKYGLFETDYPRLPNVIKHGEGSAILPGDNWGGRRVRDWYDNQSIYPDYHAPVQLMMFEPDVGGGVMLAALDGAACIKYVKCDGAFNSSFVVPAANAGVPGAAGAPTFAFALYPFAHSWWQGARHYRAWAREEANWLKKGPIATRKDFSPRLRDGGYWALVSQKGKPLSDSEQIVNRLVERVKGRVPVSVHLYNWHKHPFDTLYPDYFPAKEGLGEMSKRLTARGVLVMPYVNGRLWDRADPAFEGVKAQACQETNGVPYVETWNKRDFSAMCQGTAFWRDLMVGVADRLIDEYGVNAIYYDQIASMKAVVCYAGNHGHAIGGGSHWVDGYCRLVQTARDRHPGIAFTSENFSEPYIGVFDGFLVWSPNRATDVPLIPAIYSGYCATFACRISPSYSVEAMRAALGRTFLWGGQGGWEQDWILQDRFRDWFEFGVRLAEVRRSALEFFADGELLKEVESCTPVPKLNVKWDRWGKLVDVSVPAVQATHWRSPAGAEMVAMINYSNAPQVFDGGVLCAKRELAPGEIRLVKCPTVTPVANGARFTFDARTGALAAFEGSAGRHVMRGFENRYRLMAKSGDAEALESEDRVLACTEEAGAVVFRCTNPKMPEIEIVKKYARTASGVSRTLEFCNRGKGKRYVTPFTEGHFAAAFQTNLYHLGAGYIGPYKPFPKVAEARPVNDYKQSSKGLVFIHPDGARGNFSHFRTKIDDVTVLPWWHSTIGHYREFHDRLWYLPDGYRMGLGTFALTPGKVVSVKDRFDFFDGDLFTFFDDVFARDPDVAAELASIPKPPAWLRDIYANTHDNHDDYYFRWLLEMTDEGILMPIDCALFSWGDYRLTNGFPTTQGGFVTGAEAKALVDYQKSWSPRIKPCWYNIVISTSFFTDAYRTHPEWFRAKDREGNRDSLFPGLSYNWQTMFNYPACRDWMVDMIARAATDFGLDTVYLDEFQMTNTIDWERDQVTTDADTVRFWKQLNKRLAAEGKMLFANGSGSPYADLNYMESPHEMQPERWRDWAGVALGIGMINRLRPGQRACPLYWNGKCDYANRVLALGWIPALHSICLYVPIARAAYQYGNLLPINAKYSPDWKCDPNVEVESHSVRREDARDAFVSFINRAPAAADIPVCLQLGTLGFKADERINVWRLHLDAKLGGTHAKFVLSDAELKQNWRTNGDVRSARIGDPELVYSGAAKGAFRYVIRGLGVNQMEQFLVTASPAALFAENDLPLTAFMTAQRFARVDGWQVRVERTADVLLADLEHDFDSITANGAAVPVRRVRLNGGLTGTLVHLEKGTWNLAAKAKGRAASVTPPEDGRSGTPLLTRVRAPKPVFAPDVRQVVTLDRPVGNGVRLTCSATERSKCETSFCFQTNLPISAVAADTNNLILTAGTTRREARVCEMENYAGFEFVGARQLKLKLEHTFGTAHAVALGHGANFTTATAPKFFTGIVVDYSVGGKYTRRVTMATGLFSPTNAVALPSWGCAHAPDECLDFGDWIEGASSRAFSLDLARWAPKDWDGRAFVSLGTSRIKCGRQLKLTFLGFNDAQATDFAVPKKEQEERVMPAAIKSKPLKTRPQSLAKLDAAEWQTWCKAGPFFKLGSGKLREQTEVCLAHDYEYLYVGIDARQTEGARAGNSSPWSNDHAEILLVRPDNALYQVGADTKGRVALFIDHKRADAARIRTTSEAVPGKGWRIFLALPIDDLKFDMQRTPVTIRLNFCRVSGAPAEASSWAPLAHDFFERTHYGTAILDFNW